MCERCKEIDIAIERYTRLAKAKTTADKAALEAIEKIVINLEIEKIVISLEAEKRALHPTSA
jgi:hypothetical protein